MRSVVPSALVAAGVLAISSAARADEARPHDPREGAPHAEDPRDPHEDPLHRPGDAEPTPVWGLRSGDTVAHKHWLLYGEIGWPDVTFGFQRGVSSMVDVGLRVSTIFGVEYLLPRDRGQGLDDIALGFAFTVPIRATLVRNGKVSFLVHADPGIKFDYIEPKPFMGPMLHMGADLGVHLSARTTLTLGAEVPLFLRATPDPTGLLPFLVGLSFEHHFSEHFGVSVNVKPGILYAWNRTGSASEGILLAQLGFLGHL